MAETVVEETIIIDPKARKVDDKQAAGQAVALSVSNTVSKNQTLASGDTVTFSVTLQSAYGLRLFATPEVALYKDSVAANNQIFGGSAITPADFQVSVWMDFQATDGNNLVLKVYVRNASAGSRDVLLRARFRYILEDKAVTAS